MPDRRMNKYKKLKFYGTDVWGTVYRSANKDPKRLSTLRHLTIGYRLAHAVIDESLETTGYSLTDAEKQKILWTGSKLDGPQRQMAFYEYRLFRNFYSCLSDKEFKKAWGIARRCPNWHDALVQQLEGRAEFLVFRSGILRSVYAARALMRAGSIRAYRGMERLGTISKVRLMMKKGDYLHITFNSLKSYEQEAKNLMRVYQEFQQMTLRFPPPYMMVDYLGLSIGIVDDIRMDQVRYPFDLPGRDFTERLKHSLDTIYYKYKKRYRRETLEGQFAQPARLLVKGANDPDINVSTAKRFTWNSTRKSLFPLKPENVYQKRTIPSPVFVLPFQKFPDLGGNHKHDYFYPNAGKHTSKLMELHKNAQLSRSFSQFSSKMDSNTKSSLPSIGKRAASVSYKNAPRPIHVDRIASLLRRR